MIIREQLIKSLQEGGLDIGLDDENLEEMILDSIQFINLLVQLEVDFDLEIPEEYMGPELFPSVSRLLEILNQILDE